MQLWTPPTPPQDDNDIYIDSVMCLMYETTPIPESKLPPVYVRKERKRHKTDPSGKWSLWFSNGLNPPVEALEVRTSISKQSKSWEHVGNGCGISCC